MRVPLIYKQRPLFGFDVGSRTVKVVQLARHGQHVRVVGYGFTSFPPDTIKDSVIVKPKELATAVAPLLAKQHVGKIAAHRVVASIPMAKVFTRTLKLPEMSSSDLDQAIRFEAEQYIPVAVSDLYIDFNILGRDKGADGKDPHLDVLMVAAPKSIVDSYIKLFDELNLEVDSIETSLDAIARAMIAAAQSNKPTLVIDFGSRSADLTIYHKAALLTGSIGVGGDDLTQTLVTKLGITEQQATEIKFKFGIGPSGLQPKVKEALAPQLTQITTEIKKVIKYYKDRSESKAALDSILLSGGSASMPGLVDHLSEELKLPIAIGNPWAGLSLGHLKPVDKLAAPIYTTAIGLALRQVQA